MVRHGEILEALRKAGYRLTPQRVMVLSAMAKGKGHLSADEIYEEVRQAYPFFDLATVYRTLQLLVKLHLATAIEEAGGARFELVQEGSNQHHHMVCEECNGVFDLPPHYLNALKEQVIREVGFEPHMEHFTIHGLCAHCRELEEKKAVS